MKRIILWICLFCLLPAQALGQDLQQSAQELISTLDLQMLESAAQESGWFQDGVQGMLKLIQVSEDFVMDESIAQPWVADASGQPSPIDLAGNATAFPYTTATGHHIIICEYVYDGDQWPGLIYAYFRVSPQLVLRLQMSLGDHMANAYTYIDSLQFMGQISP